MADTAAEDGAAATETTSRQQVPKRTGLQMVREELPRSSMQLSHTFGFDAVKRNNIHILDDTTVALSFGNVAAIYTLGPAPDYQIQDTRYIFGESMGGVGCIGVHPSKKFIAVGCCAPPSTLDSGKEAAKSQKAKEEDNASKSDSSAATSTPFKPYILVYEYPSLKLVKTLREGTEQGYSCLAFSGGEGDKLASVGMFPDFLLTTWDWQKERVILRTKAFAQDVYNVSFSPNNDGFLVSSGLAHIRFWAMAKTFTGLKLQGDIGKFGKVELSDVSAYAELPDGKVLSGSEHGSLLLWDGNIIKLEIRRPGDLLPHEGEIQLCVLLRGNEG
jgi:WD40 repeat protein